MQYDNTGREHAVSYKDRHILPYTEAVLLETLRLANIGPTALPHTLDKAMVIDGQVSYHSQHMSSLEFCH